jgi:hypothetical protein
MVAIEGLRCSLREMKHLAEACQCSDLVFEIIAEWVDLPIAASWVCQVWVHHLAHSLLPCHLHAVFIVGNDKFKPPKSVFW